MAYKYLNDDGLKAYTKKVKGALKDLHTPIAISTENTTESKAQNVRNIADFVAKAKAAGIADVNGMAVSCIIDDGFSGVGYLYGNTDIIVSGIITFDDGTEPYYFLIQSDGLYSENIILMGNSQSRVTSSMLTKGARKPIILTSETTEVDEGTYQKLMSDDVDVVFKDYNNFITLFRKSTDGTNLNLIFSQGLSTKEVTADDCWCSYITVSIRMTPRHTLTSSKTNVNLKRILKNSGYLDQSILTPVPLTTTTSTNKTQLDSFLSKVPNAQVMHCIYKDVYAGTLHKIGTDWFGLLVKNTNNYEDAIQVKLQADGTLIEGTTSLAQVNAKLDTIIG